MGKKSIKENKNIYQVSREEAGLTRSQASEALVFMSDSRIEKIESEKCEPHPDEILAMAKAYKKPFLCTLSGRSYDLKARALSSSCIIIYYTPADDGFQQTKPGLCPNIHQ